jgi:glycosyltransferase involved in cell wall biosynthesis
MQVAVIIPCFNVEKHIEQTLHSVISQSHPALDIVCVDDGSTDRTVSIIKSVIGSTDRPLRLLQQSHGGACAARNAGVATTKGNYIQFLDADDLLLPDKIAKQLESALIARADLVVGNYSAVEEDGSERQIQPESQSDWMALIRTQMGTTSANLWNRDALVSAGGWDESLKSSQDYELIYRMMINGASIVYNTFVGVRVLKRTTGSISQTDKFYNWLRYITLRCDIRDHLLIAGQERYAAELEVCDQYLFMAIRAVSQYDMGKAESLFDEIMPSGFRPVPSKAISIRYIRLYRIFGFALTERIIRFLKPELYRLK